MADVVADGDKIFGRFLDDTLHRVERRRA